MAKTSKVIWVVEIETENIGLFYASALIATRDVNVVLQNLIKVILDFVKKNYTYILVLSMLLKIFNLGN